MGYYFPPVPGLLGQPEDIANVIAFLAVVLILASRRSAFAMIKADERHREAVGAS